ncbi:FtsK/SpoIIIE domain-containing protein [Amycolatopsis sp. NPDC026612]|uniref:FtsK/SpoIIIE domain-containing protein n=1 Tax=Amycolatopsis sp. NPDC026612 TaxID=3155466 RepID=UPI00340FDC41
MLDALAVALGGVRPVAADGVRIDPAVPVVASPVRDGAILDSSGFDEPRPVVPPGPVLRVLSGPYAGRSRPLSRGGTVRVGRGGGADLPLADSDVTRLHCVVQWDGARVRIADTGSRNGTVVSHDGKFEGRPRLAKDGFADLPPGEQFQVGGTRLTVEFRAPGAAPGSDGRGGLLVNRSPRLRARFSASTVEFPAPPVVQSANRGPLLLLAGLPLVLSVAMAIVWRQPSYLMWAVLSPAIAVGMWWHFRRAAKQANAAGAQDYDRRLAAAKVAVHALVDEEDAFLRREWPAPITVLERADPAAGGLWQRRAGDDDWLRFRLGRSSRAASVRVNGPDAADGWRPPRLVDAPVGADLAGGALGVAGPAADAERVLDWLLVQAAVLHGPDELRIVVLAPGSRSLLWTRWLPHLKSDSGGVLAAWAVEDLARVVKPLTDLVRNRLESRHAGDIVADTLVVLVGSRELGRRQDIADLLREGPAAGLRFVCVDDSVTSLPSRCGAVLSLEPAGDRLSLAQADPIAVTADRIDAMSAERAARILAPLRVVGAATAGAALPDLVRLSEIVPAAEENSIRAGWRLAPECTSVPIGSDASGIAHIDLVKDGPHGVIVGTTGAGKSEFVRTLVASLALANSPAHLNFLFVDFKGNSTFPLLERLPHAVGTVTNLDGALPRFFTALQAEQERRQRMFDDAGVSEFEQYPSAAARQGLPSLARLVLVVDEFAMLKLRLPTAVDDLVEVGRVGRSLGIHMLLATQDEADVTTQIKRNSELKVALRVSRAVSDLLLDSPLASEIGVRQKGRAVLRQSGVLRTVQTAWCAAPSGSAQAVALRAVPLRDSDLQLPEPVEDERKPDSAQRTELLDLIEAIALAADGTGTPHRPWLPPLPELLTRERCAPAPFALNLGLRDDPAGQRQIPFAPRLGGGHLLLVGAPQSGRTSALRAIACGLVADTSPDAVQLHAVTAGHGLGELADLPHTGVVADAGDAWRVERLLVRLGAEVQARRETLAGAGVGSLDELRERDAAAPPHLVLLVDGVDVVTERDSWAPLLQRLLEDGAAVGLTVCVTSTGTKLRARFAGLFEHRLSLRRPDNDCLGTLGFPHRADVTKLPPGRALLRDDSTLVQVPLLAADPSGTAQRTALAEEVAKAAKRWLAPMRKPLRVDRIPASLSLSQAAAYGSGPGPRIALLGVGGDELTAHWADFDKDHVVAIAGPQRSGRTTALCATALSAAANGLRVAVIATRPGTAYASLEREGVSVGGEESLAEFMARGLDVLLVDDADRMAVPEPLPFGKPGLPALVAACRLDKLPSYGRNLAQAVLAAAEVGVVLRPGRTEVLGVEFPRPVLDFPIGRGYLVSHGEAVLGRIAEPDAVTVVR